jgi:hypothetical protein
MRHHGDMPDARRTDRRTKHTRLLDEVEQQIAETRQRIEDTKEQLRRARRILSEMEEKSH